ncbi:glycosyltransferase [Enterococcus sp. N342-3-1-2]
MNKKLNILFLNNDYKSGGLQRVSSLIGKELAKSNEVHFISVYGRENFYNVDNFVSIYPMYNDFFQIYVKAKKSLRYFEKKFNSSSVYNPSNYMRYELNKVCDFIKEFKIDVVIVSGPNLISTIPFIKKKNDNIRIISWIHNNFDIYKNKYAKDFWDAFKEGVIQSDRTVCLTDIDSNSFQSISPNIMKIYNPLTIGNSDLSSLKLKNIAFSGRIAYEHKGIDLLIEIAKHLRPDWTISIAGGGNKNQISRLKKDILANNLEKKLLYLGELNSEDIKSHYLNSSIFIITSRWEGFGLVIPEAMSYGLPIISFDQIGSNEILESGKYGILVQNGNTKKFIEILNKFTVDTELRKIYSQLSLERVKNFNVDSIINSWQDMLNEVKNGKE